GVRLPDTTRIQIGTMAHAKIAARRKNGRNPFAAIEKRGRALGSGIWPWRRRERCTWSPRAMQWSVVVRSERHARLGAKTDDDGRRFVPRGGVALGVETQRPLFQRVVPAEQLAKRGEAHGVRRPNQELRNLSVVSTELGVRLERLAPTAFSQVGDQYFL